MNTQDFIKAGYQKFEPNSIDGEWANLLLEKKVYDDKGTKYFIHVYRSNLTKILGAESFTTKMQFRRDDDTMNIEILPRHDQTIESIETLVDIIWKNLFLEYYQKYDKE